MRVDTLDMRLRWEVRIVFNTFYRRSVFKVNMSERSVRLKFMLLVFSWGKGAVAALRADSLAAKCSTYILFAYY